MINFLLEVFKDYESEEAIIWKDRSYSYGWLLERIDTWSQRIHQDKIFPGTVTSLEADFSPNGVALFLALMEHRCVLVPLTSALEAKMAEFQEIAEVEVSFRLDPQDRFHISPGQSKAGHPHYQRLRELQHSGLVLFSSGSTGKSKAAVHDLSVLLEKFKVHRKRWRAITFLLYDHIGGVQYDALHPV